MTAPERFPIPLRALEGCFRGATPATIATCSPEGVPNITYLSILYYVDDTHIALSFQFFNKTRDNILSNASAEIMVPDPMTMEQYRLDVSYVRTEHEGPLFERMRANLEAVAAMTGMSGVFRLQGADIYRVHHIEVLAHDLDLSEPDVPPDRVAALDSISAKLGECDELEELLDATLDGLAELLDHRHSMILFADEAEHRLHTVASRGFSASGVGAELAFGEGLIGMAALEKRPVRVGNMRLEETFADAVRTTSIERGVGMESGPTIPLPGLPDVISLLAVPILTRDRTLGVICVQSAEVGRITIADEQVLTTLCRYLSTSIQLLGQSTSAEAPAVRAYAPRTMSGVAMQIRFHASDDTVFVDGEYLVKGLPGRILFRILSSYERDGRVDFTNRELRLDESLALGGYRDNLEARLILLRKRLEERCSAIRLTKTGRGRFRLELERAFELRV